MAEVAKGPAPGMRRSPRPVGLAWGGSRRSQACRWAAGRASPASSQPSGGSGAAVPAREKAPAHEGRGPFRKRCQAFLPQTGQALYPPRASRTFSAIAICCSRDAWLGRFAYASPP